MYASEVEYSALRSRKGFENERATIRLTVDNGTKPLEALAEAKRLVNLFLGESEVTASVYDIPKGNGPIIPEIEPVLPAIDNFEDDIPF